MKKKTRVDLQKSEYYIHADQTIVHFFSDKKTNCNQRLKPIESFYSGIFASGGLHRRGLYFRGAISVKRFLDAMHKALQEFKFLFWQLNIDREGLYVRYSDDDSFFVQLEIDKKEETINTSTLDSIIPKDKRIQSLVIKKNVGLPLCAFKLTTLIDGFAIGYYLNHVFFDQSSIFYFFQYLSHLYTYGASKLILKKPNFIELESLETKGLPFFKNIEELRMYGDAVMRFKYNPKKTDGIESLINLGSSLTVDLNFNMDEIDKLKKHAGRYVSANDIIHATILKVYVINPILMLDDVFNLYFPCNMRKRCGLEEETIGNIISFGRISLKVEYIKNTPILELAICSRQCVSEVNKDNYKKDLSWYRYFQKSNENPINYTPSFSLFSCVVTNWSTFNYDNIIFDGSTPIELKAPCSAPLGSNAIVFDNKNDKKTLKTSIWVMSHYLDSLTNLGRSTNLFTLVY